jgi:hypothetical protein
MGKQPGLLRKKAHIVALETRRSIGKTGQSSVSRHTLALQEGEKQFNDEKLVPGGHPKYCKPS